LAIVFVAVRLGGGGQVMGQVMDANAKEKAREALIAKFVSDRGFQNAAENAELQRDLRELIGNWDGLSEPSQNGAKAPIGPKDDAGVPKKVRRIILEEEPA
jgi:hypothetical protein